MATVDGSSAPRARWVSVIVLCSAAACVALGVYELAHTGKRAQLAGAFLARMSLVVLGLSMTEVWCAAARREAGRLLGRAVGKDPRALVAASDPRAFPPTSDTVERPNASYRTAALRVVADRWPTWVPTGPVLLLPILATLLPLHPAGRGAVATMAGSLCAAAAMVAALAFIRGVEARMVVLRRRAEEHRSECPSASLQGGER